MVKGMRTSACSAAVPTENTLTFSASGSCECPINASTLVAASLSSSVTPIPAATTWAYETVLNGDTPLLATDVPHGTFMLRVCHTAQSSSANIIGTYVFTEIPKYRVEFHNSSGWVKLRLYVSDGTSVVSSDVVMATSPSNCQSASGVSAQ